MRLKNFPHHASPVADAHWLAFRDAWDALAPDAPAWERAAFAWESPDGEAFAALGVAARWSSSGPDALEEARRAVPGLIADLPGARIAFGVFPFQPGDPDAPALWIVPRRLWWRAGDGTVVEHAVDPPAGRSAGRRAFPPAGPGRPQRSLSEGPALTREGWSAAVRDALARIEAGTLGKAVLARAATVRSLRPFEPVAVFETLRAAQPGAYRFLLAPADGVAFLGASPERLVRLVDGLAVADSIAGTLGRGVDGADDAHRSARLLASAKDRLEHAAVARDVRAVLERCCDTVESGVEPDVLALRHVLHLRTRVRGVPRSGTDVLDLVARLHPTPAVAGDPREAALEWIRAAEPAPRGWYAGPIGWMNAGGEGDFAVGLRCARIAGARARLYAGAGLVAGSDPDAEWNETELKMRSMRDVLAGD